MANVHLKVFLAAALNTVGVSLVLRDGAANV